MADKPKRILVSVIIPVYDVQDYLRECLDSAVNQTMAEIEIICIDDGSTDNSLSILEEYQKKDPRVKVIHQSNAGLSAARNSGLRNASGKYCYFLDGDDYVDREMLQTTVLLAEEKRLDAVVFGFERFSSSEEFLRKYPFYINAFDGKGQVLTGIEYLKSANDRGAYTVSAWSTLWRMQFLKENNLFFKEGILFEDMLFTFQAHMAAKRVLPISNHFYHYRARPDSITISTVSARHIAGSFECVKEVLNYALQKEHEQDREHEIWRAYRSYSEYTYQLYQSFTANGGTDLSFSDEIANELFHQIMSGFQINDLKVEIDRQKEENARLKIEIDSQKEENTKLKNDLQLQMIEKEKTQAVLSARQEELVNLLDATDKICSSWSFRSGRVFTWFPRKIRDILLRHTRI